MDQQNYQPYTQQTQPQMNNNQTVIVNAGYMQKPKNKWAALALCFFFGLFGAHKFYEEKTGMGILYIFTCGLFGVGIIVDFIALLFKPTHYTV